MIRKRENNFICYCGIKFNFLGGLNPHRRSYYNVKPEESKDNYVGHVLLEILPKTLFKKVLGFPNLHPVCFPVPVNCDTLHNQLKQNKTKWYYPTNSWPKERAI